MTCGGAAGLPADPADLVADLVGDGLITNYQAEQLLSGKYFLLDRLGGLDSSVYLARRTSSRARVVRPSAEQMLRAEEWAIGGPPAAEVAAPPEEEEPRAHEEPAVPAWLLAVLLFGATAAVALASSALAKLF